jgi:hypothetical protein
MGRGAPAQQAFSGCNGVYSSHANTSRWKSQSTASSHAKIVSTLYTIITVYNIVMSYNVWSVPEMVGSWGTHKLCAGLFIDDDVWPMHVRSLIVDRQGSRIDLRTPHCYRHPPKHSLLRVASIRDLRVLNSRIFLFFVLVFLKFDCTSVQEYSWVKLGVPCFFWGGGGGGGSVEIHLGGRCSWTVWWTPYSCLRDIICTPENLGYTLFNNLIQDNFWFRFQFRLHSVQRFNSSDLWSWLWFRFSFRFRL